jgi:hypoxanthine-DNA glycosylase
VKSASAARTARAARRPRAARIRSFPPVARRDAHTLILGSMPGAASLAAGRYYAHPRNAFWRIVADLLGFAAEAPYPERKRALQGAGIALWDVLHSCVREGSLDTRIDDASEVAHDFRAFFRTHPRIERVFFNGAKAEASFRRHVVPGLRHSPSMHRLPSTSPAHAALDEGRKRAAWRAILPDGRKHRP